MQLLRRHWKIAVPVAVVALAAGWWLAFSFFGVQTLFFDDEVNEAGPTFDSGAESEAAPTSSTTTPPTTTSSGSSPETTAPPTTAPPTTAPPTAAAPAVVRVVEGMFGARSHPGSGTAVVLNDGSEQRFLRLEDDFSTDNGPDLNVYLSAAPASADEGAFDDDFIDLGDLKGNVGAQNYEIPVDVDLDRYGTVVIWCVRFGVAFTTADLA